MDAKGMRSDEDQNTNEVLDYGRHLNIEEYLTQDETLQIIQQFRDVPLQPGHQVMWSGVPRDKVQEWADKRGLQTLTTAMGPLMDKAHIACRKPLKTPGEWSRYVVGASAIFAMALPKDNVVTVVLRPPPNLFNPAGLSTFQQWEEPALKGISGGPTVSQVNVVHITVKGAEDFVYQLWPNDHSADWVAKFGLNTGKQMKTKSKCANNTSGTNHSNQCVPLGNNTQSSSSLVSGQESKTICSNGIEQCLQKGSRSASIKIISEIVSREMRHEVSTMKAPRSKQRDSPTSAQKNVPSAGKTKMGKKPNDDPNMTNEKKKSKKKKAMSDKKNISSAACETMKIARAAVANT